MKKGAVAGAIVWSAPLLTSTPAFAATAKCAGSKPCTTWYYAKKEAGKPCTSGATGDGSGTNCANLQAVAACPPASSVTFQDGCGLMSNFDHTGTYASGTFPANSVPLYFQLKPGSNCYTFEWNGSAFVYMESLSSQPLPPGCLAGQTAVYDSATKRWTVTFSWNSGTGCQGISHINAYFCL